MQHNMSRTHDCTSLNAANDLRFIVEVRQESRHTSGVSQGKNKTKPSTNAMLPCPVQKTKPQKKTYVPQDPHPAKSHSQSLDGVIVLRQHLLDGFGDL